MKLLTSREKKILKLLLKKDGIMTTSEIAVQLGVSSRTIKADIKKINEELEGKDCMVESKVGVGFWLHYEPMGEKYLQKIFFIQEESLVSSEVRSYYIAIRLLQRMDFISIEKVTQDMYISKSTVINDLIELEHFLKKYRISLIRKAKYGIRINGDEIDIRKAYVAAIGKIIGPLGKNISEKVAPFLGKMEVESFHDILRTIELHTGFSFADISYEEIFLQMAVTLYRVQSGFLVTAKELDLGDKLYKEDKKDKIGLQRLLKGEIQEAYHVALQENDLDYIVNYIYSAKQQLDIAKSPESLPCFNQSEAYHIMMSILNRAEELYSLDLRADEELFDVFVQHLERLFRRSKNSIHVDNPFLETIKNNMVYEYEIAAYIVSQFNEIFHVEVHESEISFITLYIGAIFERIVSNQLVKRQPVVLVCAIGTGEAEFLQAKMTRVFPEITIRRVVPHNKLHRVELYHSDLVISTMPVALDGSDTFCISPILDTKDIQSIGDYLKRKNVTLKSQDTHYPRLSRLMDRRITILQCDCKTKEEVINLLGMRMAKEGYVDEEYIQSVLEREQLSDTSVGNNFATPHAFGSHVLTAGIGLMTLKRPIYWGKNKAQVVLMLALHYKTKENLHAIFTEVTDLMNDAYNVDQLIKAKKFSKLILMGNHRRKISGLK
jgi:Transcriptional antiterminator